MGARTRRVWSGVAAFGLVIGACSSGSESDQGSPAAPTTEVWVDVTLGTAPPAQSHVTYPVDDGLVEPVPYEGEPTRDADAPVGGTGDLVWFEPVYVLPTEFSLRQVFYAEWTDVLGFHRYVNLGPGTPRETAAAGPDHLHEVWVMDGDYQPVRRLLSVDVTGRDDERIVFELAEGYESLSDVLQLPPPADGNYLVEVRP